ncbi:thiamine pyrophosphate-dependent enzyme [Halalkalibacter oceani]|uniref:thiamine pyrophosphate-dependent enzyme n=1 Tax=Halalkalibacter oceani TaxID=1653776 RepID=UPI0034957A8E
MKMMSEAMTGAQAVVKCIKLEQIDKVFCVPGESYLDVMDAIYDEETIELVSTRHEGGASFMAEAYGKATGKPGVAMATRGVGGANLAIGIHTAYQDSTPMVVFLGQVDSKFRGREGFQEVELDQFFMHISKWTVEIRDVERIPELVQRAFRIAKSGRPGPVVVSLPADILAQTTEMEFGPISRKPRPKLAEEEARQCLSLLSSSEKPLIIAGGGVTASNAEAALLAFAEKMNIPVLASFRRHDVFPNNHPLYVGHSGLGTFQSLLQTIREADTIFAIGTRFSEVTTQGYSVISPKQTIIHIDIEYSTLGKVYPPQLGIVSDAKEALETLNQLADNTALPKEDWKKWAEERRTVYEQVTFIPKMSNSDKVDMKQIIRTLQEKLPDDAILTNDAGNFSAWLHSYFQFSEPKTYVGPTSGAMGYGVPGAVGVKMAKPDRTVVSLSGDGGFMMTVQELETAVRYHTPIVALVFNNSMYGTIRMHQEKTFPERVIGTDLGSVHFCELGQALGVFSQRVAADADFEDALSKALDSGRPAMIEIMCNPENISVQSTITELRNAARK